MSITVQQLSYIHPDQDVLFQDISFSVQQGQKVALIGNNGSGKSTLMQMMAGRLSVSSGEIISSSVPYYVPQHFGQYNQLSVAEALQIDKKLKALHAILDGDASLENFNGLADDWNIEERATASMSSWGLNHIELSQNMNSLSGGEKTKVFLAGIEIHSPEIILMDEPTNHLDLKSRKRLNDFILNSNETMVIISHDRALLNLLTSIYELTKNEVIFYPGNYEFYKTQKEQMIHSLYTKLNEKEKELRLARKVARETAEKKQKQDVRGEKRSAKSGIPRIAMGNLKDAAEKSSSKLKNVHSEKMGSISESLSDIRSSLPDLKAMKVDLNGSSLHKGKILVTAKGINFGYHSQPLWKTPLDFQIISGDRISIEGTNGSGKTSLLKLITGSLKPTSGTLVAADFRYVYLDQEYSIIQNELTIFEQIQQFNSGLLEHELKTILNRFLFPRETWDKTCDKLSGGEKMRLVLCCLMVNANTPDMLILDEPTNNIDIRNIEILTSVVKDYQGTVLVVSHDEYFLEQIEATQQIRVGE